jgi:hypothetical protein
VGPSRKEGLSVLSCAPTPQVLTPPKHSPKIPPTNDLLIYFFHMYHKITLLFFMQAGDTSTVVIIYNIDKTDKKN